MPDLLKTFVLGNSRNPNRAAYDFRPAHGKLVEANTGFNNIACKTKSIFHRHGLDKQ